MKKARLSEISMRIILKERFSAGIADGRCILRNMLIIKEPEVPSVCVSIIAGKIRRPGNVHIME